MAHFSVSVYMSGFESIADVISADDKKQAEVKAVKMFLDKNDIQHDAQHSEDDLIRFYGPKVKKVRVG
jgi:hypothetical protein